MARLNHIDGHFTWDGKRVRLSLERYVLVLTLTKRPGEVLTFEALRDAIWGTSADVGSHDDGSRRALRALVYQTNGQFRAIDPMFDKIEAVSGIGYRWRSTVKMPAFDLAKASAA